MRWLILLPVLIVALLLVTFGVQNTQLVNVRFLSFEASNLSTSIVINAGNVMNTGTAHGAHSACERTWLSVSASARRPSSVTGQSREP